MGDVETLLDEIDKLSHRLMMANKRERRIDLAVEFDRNMLALRAALQSVKVEAKDTHIQPITVSGEVSGYRFSAITKTKHEAEAIHNLLTGGENGPSMPK